jgi:putative FmdB family regulatory protein
MLSGPRARSRAPDDLALPLGECQGTGYASATMPIYEYRCDRGHTFETLQRMTDEPLSTCEKCDAPATRVLHAPAVHFKGSGFYNTDYGTRKRAREKNGSESNGDGKSGEKSTSDAKASDSGTKAASSA